MRCFSSPKETAPTTSHPVIRSISGPCFAISLEENVERGVERPVDDNASAATARRGRFITIEGVEGAGKSTQLGFIKGFLESRGKHVLLTREPGGTPLAEAVRALLLNPDNTGMTSDAETLLLFAARAEHVAKVILPALEQSRWVVCDRFSDATYAYQGGGRGISEDRIALLEDWVQGSLRPDLTLILDVPVALGLSRVHGRGEQDRFEREGEGFLGRVRDVYLRRARHEENRCRIIDTGRSSREVSGSIGDVLEGFLKVTDSR